MTEPVTTGWTDFAEATAGAAAALAGHVMVAISVNIRQILGLAGVSARAAATIGSLILVVPSIVLILTVIGSMDDAWVLMVQILRYSSREL